VERWEGGVAVVWQWCIAGGGGELGMSRLGCSFQPASMLDVTSGVPTRSSKHGQRLTLVVDPRPAAVHVLAPCTIDA
jgi:hypothetical protein